MNRSVSKIWTKGLLLRALSREQALMYLGFEGCLIGVGRCALKNMKVPT
jgi:hypothetical protein